MKTKTSFRKGEAKGKPKGAVNHTTKDIKQAFQLLVESNLENMQGWLNTIAAKDPARALNLLIELSEYVVPKLARTELNGKFSNEFIPEDLSLLTTDELVRRADALRIVEKSQKK